MYNPSRMDVKKRIYLVIAMIFGIALLTAGTLAWRSMPPVRQKHDYSVKLNQLFEPVKDWKQGETIPQNVSVTNLENSHDEIFVRLSLKEFMKTTQPSEGFIKDKSGEIILFATFAEGEQMGEFLKTQDAKTVMPDHQYGSMLVQTGIDRNGDPVYTDYATTNHTEVRNGIYGKPMTVPGTVVRIWGTPFDGGNTIHEIPDNTVCDYEAYSWDGRGALSHDGEQGGIRDYITFTGAQITKLADWAAQDEPEWGDFWIVDPHDGWAYWGRPLAPGITTDDFIEAVTLQQSPAAETDRFDYWMHIDLQAIGGPLEDFVQELPFFYDDEYDEVGGNRDDKQTLLDKMLGFISNRDSVDRSRLEAAIDLAGELEEKQEDYTVGSWNAMQDVLTESSRVYHDPDAKQFEITDAAIALEDAIDALVDLSALRALVAEADELVQEHYSEESWGPFAEALRHATEDVLADENATQDQVEGAWNELNERMSELTVDRSRLEAAIDLAGELEEKQEDYTVGSWNAMQGVLTESSRVYHDPDAKQFEITDVAIALEDAIDALVDLSALRALVAEADELVQEHYSEESWGPFAEALRHATEDVLADENATQDQVDTARETLDQRMKELTVDRSRLEAAIDLAGELEEKQEDYTVGSWNAMQDVLTESSRVYHDPDAKQFEITDVAIALEDAIDALVDLTKLQAALADAEQKKETDYTFDSWDRFVPVWDLAQEVRNDPNATQEQVDQAEGDLILAMLALNTAIIQTPNPALRAVATGRRVLHRDTGIGNMMEVAQYRSPGTTDLPEGKIYSFVMAEDTDDALQYWGFTERNVTHYMNLSLTGEMLAYSVRWRANSLWNPQPESMVYIPEFAHIRNYAMTNNVPTSEQATAPWTGSPPAQDEGYSIPVRKAIMSDDGRSPDTDVAIPISGQEAYYYYSLHSDVGSQNIDRNRMRSDLWLRSRGSSDEYCYLSKGSHETPGQIIMQEGQNLLEGSRVAMWVDSSIFAEFLNREDLGGLINRADNLESDDYTVESWEVLTEAISQATAVHQKEEASQRQVDLAARLLQQAIHNLVSRTALRKEIESLNDRTPSHYTQASYEDALQVLSHAASVYEDPNATREQVNEAGDALAQVMSEMVDVRLLRETIDQAEQKDSEGYTSGSWTNFAQALHEAKEVINRSDASQQHVNDHLAALQSATQALIPELQAVHGRMLLNAATDAGVWHEMARYGDYSLILSGEDLLYLGHPWDDSLQRDSYLSLPLQGNNIRARANDHWTAVTSTSIPRSAQMRQYAVISDQLDDASGGSIPGDADAQVDDTDVVFPLSEYEAMTYYSKHSAIGIQNFGRHVNDNSQWLRSVSFEKQPAYIRGGDADVNPGFVFYADVTQRMGFRPAMWVRSSIFTGDAAIEGMALNGLIEQGKHRLQEMPAAQNKSSLESMITDAQRIVENPETTQQQLTDAVERFQRVLHQVESAHE